MSRFTYKVYVKDHYVGDFTSINQICNSMYDVLQVSERKRLIEAFKLPDFSKRVPQTYVDESINLKVVSEYVELTGKL